MGRIKPSIMTRVTAEHHPKVMPLAEALIEAAVQKGATVGDLKLAMEIIDDWCQGSYSKLGIDKLGCD